MQLSFEIISVFKWCHRYHKMAALWLMTGGGNSTTITIDNARDGTDAIEYVNVETGQAGVYNTKTKKYKPPTSDEQIRTIVRSGNLDEVARLIRLIGKYVEFGRGRVHRISRLLDLPDSMVYRELCPNIKRNEGERAQAHAEATFHAFERVHAKEKFATPARYLDFGCGDGSISREFGKLIRAGETHGVDILARSSPDIQYRQIVDGKLPYPDGYFDFITAFVSLHHVADLKRAIGELHRVCKPGGYILIKEHDCWNALDSMIVDIEHSIFLTCVDKVPLVDNHTHHYKNYYGWDAAMSPFKYIDGDYYYAQYRHEVTPSRIFWGMYKK